MLPTSAFLGSIPAIAVFHPVSVDTDCGLWPSGITGCESAALFAKAERTNQQLISSRLVDRGSCERCPAFSKSPRDSRRYFLAPRDASTAFLVLQAPAPIRDFLADAIGLLIAWIGQYSTASRGIASQQIALSVVLRRDQVARHDRIAAVNCIAGVCDGCNHHIPALGDLDE